MTPERKFILSLAILSAAGLFGIYGAIFLWGHPT